MAAELPFLPGITRDLAPVVFIYAGLITTIALTAVFSSRPTRRKAALEVLRLLLPGRNRSGNQRQIKDRTTRRRRDPPNP